MRAGVANTSGGENSFFGVFAGFSNKGFNNTAIGYQASVNTTTGIQNTSLGSNSFINNTTGSYNTAVGYNTGPNNIDFSNTTCLGIDASATGNNMVRIGNIYVGSIGGFQNWTTFPSDGRFKQNVNEDVPGLSFVMNLRPVTYTLDVDGINQSLGIKESQVHASIEGNESASSMVHTGFIAQEVEIAAKMIGYNFSGVDAPKNSKDYYGLSYAEFVVPLVKAVQEQQVLIEKQNIIIEQQNQKLELLMKEINMIKEKLR